MHPIIFDMLYAHFHLNQNIFFHPLSITLWLLDYLELCCLIFKYFGIFQVSFYYWFLVQFCYDLRKILYLISVKSLSKFVFMTRHVVYLVKYSMYPWKEHVLCFHWGEGFVTVHSVKLIHSGQGFCVRAGFLSTWSFDHWEVSAEVSVIMELPVSPFSFIYFCIMYFDCVIRCRNTKDFYFLDELTPFYHFVLSPCISAIFSYAWVYFILSACNCFYDWPGDKKTKEKEDRLWDHRAPSPPFLVPLVSEEYVLSDDLKTCTGI